MAATATKTGRPTPENLRNWGLSGAIALAKQYKQTLERVPSLRNYVKQITLPAAYVENLKTTVVILCRNQQKDIPAIVQCLSMQTRKPDLVILSDDNSSDDSCEVFLRACRQYRLRAKATSLSGTDRRRLCRARNVGFQDALDGLVLLLDGDLLVGPGYLEGHRNIHASRRAPVCSVGPRFESAHPDGSGPVNFMWGSESVTSVSPSPDDFCPVWNGGNGAFGCLKRIWSEVGAFDESFDGKYGIDDLDFSFRLFLAHVWPVGSFEAYTIHRPHNRSGFSSHFNEGLFKGKYGIAVYDPIYELPHALRGGYDGRSWAEHYAAMTSAKTHSPSNFPTAPGDRRPSPGMPTA